MSIKINKESIRHAPCYCEENIWHLAQRQEFAGYDPHAVFISNFQRIVHFEAQRICDGTHFMCWDYHVILIAEDSGEWFVFDPDSTLDFGCGLQEYLTASFPFGDRIAQAPLFRVIKAAEYTRSFSSDRRHMRKADGSFHASPPVWPVIQGAECSSFNLWDFVDMVNVGQGEVLDLVGLRERFTGMMSKPRITAGG